MCIRDRRNASYPCLLQPLRVRPRVLIPVSYTHLDVYKRQSLYSTLPALISLIAFVTSMVTVPAFGLGIKPFGPSTRPRRPTTPIISGVATTTSKSSQPSFWIFGINSSAPTKSAPAAKASSALGPLANTKILTASSMSADEGRVEVLGNVSLAVDEHDRDAGLLRCPARSC